MRNLFKKWALVAAVFSVTLFQLGCGSIPLQYIAAWLNEDAFG